MYFVNTYVGSFGASKWEDAEALYWECVERWGYAEIEQRGKLLARWGFGPKLADL